MDKTCILLTGAGAPGMPGILKCLKKAEKAIRLVGCDADANAPSRNEFDAFYKIPFANSNKFTSTLLDICIKEKVDIVIPVVTRELETLSQNKERFDEIGVILAVMPYEKLQITNNKGLLLDFMRDNGLPTAEYYIANNVEELENAFEKIGYRDHGAVVKPVIGNGSRGVRIIDVNKSAFESFFNEKPNGLFSTKNEIINALQGHSFPCSIMIMQFLPGAEYSVDIVADEGRILAAVCRVGLEVASSNQTRSMVIDRPDVINQCAEVVKKLELSGNIGFDLKEDISGNVFILEINPRLTGGIVTCLAAGANMPWLGIESWLKEEVKQPDLQYGVVMQRYWNERFYDSKGQEIIL
ncbi:MAG: ATP-grasp domain-containing protein [Mogibacterium sp.]|nr:ATP-grasp domain-containing protein [Mogibacterium sp.]